MGLMFLLVYELCLPSKKENFMRKQTKHPMWEFL